MDNASKENDQPQITLFLSQPKLKPCVPVAHNTRSQAAIAAGETWVGSDCAEPVSSQEYTTSQEEKMEESGAMSQQYRARKRFAKSKQPAWRVKSPVPETVVVYVNGVRPNDPVFQCTTKEITVPFVTAPGDVGTQLRLYHKYFLGDVPPDQARMGDRFEVSSFSAGKERADVERSRTDADVEEVECGTEEWDDAPDQLLCASKGSCSASAPSPSTRASFGSRALEEDVNGDCCVFRGVRDHAKARGRWLSVEAGGAGNSDDEVMSESEADRNFQVEDHVSDPESEPESAHDQDETLATVEVVDSDDTVNHGSGGDSELDASAVEVIEISSDEE